jgi:hypothetical protein
VRFLGTSLKKQKLAVKFLMKPPKMRKITLGDNARGGKNMESNSKRYIPKNKQITEKGNREPDKMTIPAIYPNARFEKTNMACPDTENVERSREWVEYDQL